VNRPVLGGGSTFSETVWGRGEHETPGRIEKIFGTWIRSYGLRRMRWPGIGKATTQVLTIGIAYNLTGNLTITTQPA
jgi:transposase, IS5 family